MPSLIKDAAARFAGDDEHADTGDQVAQTELEGWRGTVPRALPEPHGALRKRAITWLKGAEPAAFLSLPAPAETPG